MTGWKLWAIPIVIGLSVLLTLLSSLGIVVMRESYQKLHFSSIVVGVSAPLLAVAVWLETQDAQARIKVCLVVILEFIINGIINHAIARAYRVKTVGHWELYPEDQDVIRGGDQQ